jgi:SHS family sialic acid transporter-like MFS transporter
MTTTTTDAVAPAAVLDAAAPRIIGARERWLVLLAAFLGWMFDGLEMGIFPLVARPALSDLLKTADSGTIGWWHGVIDASFLLGAALGGLVFGWFGDRIGRVRAMSLSILMYSLFTGFCYFAQSPWQIGALRFVSAIGMGGEWALGVALVMEVWPERHRPMLAGAIGAASNVGFLSIAVAGWVWPVTGTSWRWVMLAGVLPALLTFFIRQWVPESQRWQDSVKAGPSRPLREVFSPALRRRTLLAIVFASVALIGTWGSVQKIAAWVGGFPGAGAHPSWKAQAQIMSSCGAIAGSLVAPLVGARFGRRPAYFALCLLSLAVCGALFRGFAAFSVPFLLMVALAGAVTAAFYGWLPLYLPELFPTRVRATGQGIAYNFGRIAAAAGALAGSQLVAYWGDYGRMGAAVSLVYVVGLFVIWLAPETKGKPLPE